MYYYIARKEMPDIYDIGTTLDESQTMEKNMPIMFKIQLYEFASMYTANQLKHLTKYKVKEGYYKLDKANVEILIKMGIFYSKTIAVVM
ncbi:hypothetical protein [Epiphyas postvittana nucleopolyhedrovirus]|uniref:Uncharacterized protein n=1 Tax=Epiphyas postvittana nucleopolyhedrovirus TaxID=70600 RepID=Q91GM2_NPVEP|nr:hypothetical protein [Epiphyas postvittana nucleopolyhedrovirus]AAK85592.1 unknown [Epiphyas postvittana nucleopolyhedrovirus]